MKIQLLAFAFLNSARPLNALSILGSMALFLGLCLTPAHADYTGTLSSLADDAQVCQLTGTKSVAGQTATYNYVGAFWSGTRMGVEPGYRRSQRHDQPRGLVCGRRQKRHHSPYCRLGNPDFVEEDLIILRSLQASSNEWRQVLN